MSKIEDWCPSELLWISDAYKQVHGYVSIAVCLIGTVGNVLNVIIFGQKKKAVSPVNIILRWLSTVNLMVLIIVIPFNWILYVHKSTDVQKYSYPFSMASLCYLFVTQTLLNIGIWLTVTLAIWRYIAIAYPLRMKFWCTVTSTRRVILFECVVCALLCAPILYTFRIWTHELIINQFGFIAKEGNLTKLYSVDLKEPANVVIFFNFIMYSVLLRLVPSILMILLSVKLLTRLTKRKKIRRQLMTSTMNVKSKKQMERTTTMTLALLFLFLLNEFLQIVLILLVFVYGERVFYICFNPMGEILDLFGLVHFSLHFFLYYAISRSFRTSLYRIMHGWRCARCSHRKKNEYFSPSGGNEKSFSRYTSRLNA